MIIISSTLEGGESSFQNQFFTNIKYKSHLEGPCSVSKWARGASDHIKVCCRRRQEQHYLTASRGASSRSHHFRSALASASTSPLPARQHPVALPSRLHHPIHLSSVNKHSLIKLRWAPLGISCLMTASGMWICFAYYQAAIMDLSITGLQNESLSGICETVTFLQIEVKSDLPCSLYAHETTWLA